LINTRIIPYEPIPKTMKSDINNYNEEVNKRTILEGVKGLTPELRKAILSAPKSEQRKLIFKVMVDNNVEHRLIGDKIQTLIQQNNLYSTRHIKTVIKMLREYVGVSATDTKTMGEVMTPTSLVMDMLDTLPKDVWSNPELKWLDPCNGVGIFPAVIIDRLMEGLMSFEPNEELRYKHIMEEMIYVSELQAKNMFLYLYAFDPEDKFALNVYNGSYLEFGFDIHMDMLEVDKFDIVVMNPPYQELKDGNTKSQAIWDKFVLKAIDGLNEGGYLVAVHPDSWRGLGKAFNIVRNALKSKQMTYLELHNKFDGAKTFGAHTSYDFYCLHNVPNTMSTKIKCQDGKIENADLSKMEFIPNGMFNKFQKLMSKKDEEKLNILYSRSAYGNDKDNMSKEQTEEFSYPCIYYTYKDGTFQLRYSNTNQKGHFGIPKVIWSAGSASTPIIDKNGDYGVMNFACSIVDELENLPLIQEAMLNPEFIKLMSFADGNGGVGGQRYNHKVIATFRKDFWKEFI